MTSLLRPLAEWMRDLPTTAPACFRKAAILLAVGFAALCTGCGVYLTPPSRPGVSPLLWNTIAAIFLGAAWIFLPIGLMQALGGLQLWLQRRRDDSQRPRQ
jgi:hypothetical protein